MEFDHLKGFFYVAKLGSFTEAAGRLYVTQPAISLQVKALEKEVGEKLFDRVGRSIKLTHAGSILYRQVEGLIAKLDEIQRTVGEIKSLEVGRLFLGASDTTSMYFLPCLLKAFLKVHARIDLRIVSLISAHVIRKVLDREIDLGIVTLSGTVFSLETLPLFRQQFVCIACRDHPFADRKVVDLQEISGEPMIVLEKQCLTRQIIDGHLEQQCSKLRPVIELSNFEIIKHYVCAGLGIALVPEAAVQSARDGISVIRLRNPLSVDVGIVFRKDRELSQPARAFLVMAREFFSRSGDPVKRALGPRAS